MDPMRFNCECGQRLKAEASKLGKKVRCPRCGADNWVVDGEAREAASADATTAAEIPVAESGNPVSSWIRKRNRKELTAIGCAVFPLSCCIASIISAIITPVPRLGGPGRNEAAPTSPEAAGGLSQRITKSSVDEGHAFVDFNLREAYGWTQADAQERVLANAKEDVAGIVRMFSRRGDVEAIHVSGYSETTDRQGNRGRGMLFAMTYSKATASRISQKGFRVDDVFRVADKEIYTAIFRRSFPAL